MKLYTFTGDYGNTKTLDGRLISKNDPTIMINGEIDSLQCQLDRVIAIKKNKIVKKQKKLLIFIQRKLWQLGGEVSQQKVGGVVKEPITKEDILLLEKTIDSFNINLTGFVRFSKLEAIEINEARVRTRKVERLITQHLKKSKIRSESYVFVNRLSDYFFSLAVSVQTE